MLVLYFSFALVCLYSVLGHPTSKRADSDDVWETLYEGHNAYESEMDHDHPGLREDLATNGQRRSSLMSSLLALILNTTQIQISW